MGNECNAQMLCTNDKRCDNGYCVPWEEGAYDNTCAKATSSGSVRPHIQCVWTGDPVTKAATIAQTPLVVNLGIETTPGAPPRPSIVFIASNGSVGSYVTVIDGATCEQLGAATTSSADPLVDELMLPTVTLAAGDLNGDGRTDVVGLARKGGLLAFTWDLAQKRLIKLWKSTYQGANDTFSGSDIWGGLSLYDLNDDGRPEIMYHGWVWSPDGVRLSSIPGLIDSTEFEDFLVTANIDNDPAIELVSGQSTWEWNSNTNAFVAERAVANRIGYTGLADFGDLPNTMTTGTPEIVYVTAGHFVVLDLKGTVLRNFTANDYGGPPTIADYDGDGKPEIGAAFQTAYVVYDPIDNKKLWSVPMRDGSAKTGSSVFDFNGDGKAEVVYGDECYVRVFDGSTGEVQFSQAYRSKTWNTMPVVADVDGDFAAEIVVAGSNGCDQNECGDHNGDNVFDDIYDPLFKGLRCDVNDDCLSKQCDQGFCRCTDDKTCDEGYGCTAPLANTPGTAKVCRASHTTCSPGIRVFRDGLDEWQNARPMWNQHAYFITNVNDDGTIPKSSEFKANWATEGLNNFRQNVPGVRGPRPVADLTVRMDTLPCTATTLSANVCNRGAALADLGVPVVFAMAENAQELCRTMTAKPLSPGECVTVGCDTQMSGFTTVNVSLELDPRQVDCQNGNNGGSTSQTCSVAF